MDHNMLNYARYRSLSMQVRKLVTNLELLHINFISNGVQLLVLPNNMQS